MKIKGSSIINLAIVGLFQEYNDQVASLLADQLEMYFLNTNALFEFEISPNTTSDMIRLNGVSYYRKKQDGFIGYVCTFKNTVLTFDSGVLLSKAKMKQISDNGLVIYLHHEMGRIKKYQEAKQYLTPELKKLFCLKDSEIERRSRLARKFADITINASKIGVFKCMSEVIRNLKKYYKVEGDI